MGITARQCNFVFLYQFCPVDKTACANRSSFLTQTRPSGISNLLKLQGDCDLPYLSSDKQLLLLQYIIKALRPSFLKELNMQGRAQTAVSASKSENSCNMFYVHAFVWDDDCLCNPVCANLLPPDGPVSGRFWKLQ